MAWYQGKRFVWFGPLEKKKWDGKGRCPHCGGYQGWVVSYDDSFRLRLGGFDALVSCFYQRCGKQVRLKVRGGKSKAEKV